MNNQEIRQKLKSEEYDFLRTDKHLGDNIIFLTCGGSHSYGTNVEGSDLDIRGITIEQPNEIIGMSNFEQFMNEPTDTTIYGLRKVVKLMSNCNPNVIEMLGTKDDQIFVNTPQGQLLKDNVDLFLTKKAISSFGGYATAQLRRLENALARDSYPQPEKEKHILNTIKTAMIECAEQYQELGDGTVDLYIDKSDKEDYDTEIFIDANVKHYPLRDFKNIHSIMFDTLKNYGKLTQRNSKKDEPHLLKHAMHLMRLLLTGIDILSGKGIITYREKDLKLLIDIRNGKYTYSEIFELVDKYEKLFKEAVNNCTLPNKPDFKKIEELVFEIYKGWIKW